MITKVSCESTTTLPFVKIKVKIIDNIIIVDIIFQNNMNNFDTRIYYINTCTKLTLLTCKNDSHKNV